MTTTHRDPTTHREPTTSRAPAQGVPDARRVPAARPQRGRRRARDWWVHVLLAVGGVFIGFPFVWVVLTALRTEQDINAGGLLPHQFTVENFVSVWRQLPLLRYYANSLLVAGGILIGQLVTSIPAGYALARMKFRGSRGVFWIVLLCILVPTQVSAIPVYLMLSSAGLLNTLGGLILPFLGSAFGVYLFRQFFLQLPESVIEAARLDGAGTARIIWHMVLPMSRPAVISFSVFSVSAHWNDFFWPFFTLRGDSVATVPFGIAMFASNESGTQYGLQMAAALFAIAPLIVFFLFFQRRFITGIALQTER
ncbi:carbohydrate ABC transporter permease [Streptomyces sp. NPDC093085]|uniref:carbohydrate ABC transporter permease n=1 Tax=Streptomyces sp. NPDC093085 TaxID=3155068 RepID=UPI00342D2E34